MSTGIGTLQAPRPNRSIWPAAVIATFAMLAIGVAAFSLSRDDAPQNPAREQARPTVVQGTAANTPSELRGAIEAPAGAAVAPVPHIPRRGTAEGSTEGNTPSEVRPPTAFQRTAHQRI